jgi:DNA-binding SARP family transcriptional activator
MIGVDLKISRVFEVSQPAHGMMICLLGEFRVLAGRRPLIARRSGKTEALLYQLALADGHRMARESILFALWPDTDPHLAGSALNSLIYSLQKRFSPVLGGAAPVIYADGSYALNLEAGIAIDIDRFDALADAGDHHWQAGRHATALTAYGEALALYQGDLYTPDHDLHTVIERERLRARYLSILARVADQYFTAGDCASCLEAAQRIVSVDACREDAHRLIMRCYVRQGQRAAALRQYRLCEEMLRAEFDACPEPSTTALFEQIRCNPAAI